MRSWYAIRALGEGAEIAIYDEIGAFGVSARGFLAELGALADAAPLTVRLNSPGGSVFDAVAIHNALTRRAGPVTVWIDGIAASAASYVAMAGEEVVMQSMKHIKDLLKKLSNSVLVCVNRRLLRKGANELTRTMGCRIRGRTFSNGDYLQTKGGRYCRTFLQSGSKASGGGDYFCCA